MISAGPADCTSIGLALRPPGIFLGAKPDWDVEEMHLLFTSPKLVSEFVMEVGMRRQKVLLEPVDYAAEWVALPGVLAVAICLANIPGFLLSSPRYVHAREGSHFWIIRQRGSQGPAICRPNACPFVKEHGPLERPRQEPQQQPQCAAPAAPAGYLLPSQNH